jgi:acyl-CoA reductase-like NAD-dependent aldehyde dehydrogenase
MTIWHEERLLIGGELVPAENAATYDDHSPFTEEVIGVAADATVDDARRAIVAARKAFDTTGWSRDREFRVRCLRQLHQALVDHAEQFRQILVNEVGMPHQTTFGAGLDAPTRSVEWYADLLETYEFSEDLGVAQLYGGQHRRWVEKEAAGVVAAIVAYNYPVQLALAKIAPALAAGCTVVLKGAPQTPWSALALGRIVAEHTDIPAGVFNVITSTSADVASELTTHEDVDLVSFTGSTPVGKKIMSAAADTVKRVFLELGGKSAMVVLDDADMNTAAAFCSYAVVSHCGQGCAITSRLIVPRERYDEVAAIAGHVLSTIPYGDPADPDNRMGPLISAEQRAKVVGYVDRAVAAGAKAVVGGAIPEHLPTGYFYEPTLIVGADEDSEIAQDELFGPVLVLLPHDGDEDASRIANNSIFGLSGAVLSADRDRALKVARAVRAGTMSVNGGLYFSPDAPFGGYKQSGFGREMGVASLDEFLERKTLAEPVSS